MNDLMQNLLEKLGITLDDVLRSTLTILVWFALIGLAAWFLFRSKLKPPVIAGYAAGALYLLWVNAQNSKQDKTWSGDAQQYNDMMAGVSSASGGSAIGAGMETGVSMAAIRQFMADQSATP